MVALAGFDIQARSGRVDGEPDRDGVRFVTDDGETRQTPAPDRSITLRPGDRVTAVYLARTGDDIGRCIALENHSRGQWARWDAAIADVLPGFSRGRLWERAVAAPSVLMVAAAWVATQASYGGVASMAAWSVAGVCGVAALGLVIVLQRASVRSEYLMGRIEAARDTLLERGRKAATGLTEAA